MEKLAAKIDSYASSTMDLTSFSAGGDQVTVLDGRSEEDINRQFDAMFSDPDWMNAWDNFKDMLGASRKLYEKSKKNELIEKSVDHFQRLIVDLDVMFSLAKKSSDKLSDRLKETQERQNGKIQTKLDLQQKRGTLSEDSPDYENQKTRLDNQIAMIETSIEADNIVAVISEAQILEMAVDSLWATYRRERQVGWTDTGKGVKSLSKLAHELENLLNEILYLFAEFKKKSATISPELQEDFQGKLGDIEENTIADTVQGFKDELADALPESVMEIVSIDDLQSQLETMRDQAKLYFENGQQDLGKLVMDECHALHEKLSKNEMDETRIPLLEECSVFE